MNRQIPFVDEPNPPAQPFPAAIDKIARARALECLTSAVYYEAGAEPIEGQQAVAQVVLNRVRHPAFPGSVCAVVYQGSTRDTGCQFSFTCDGSLLRGSSTAAWARARKVAEAALSGQVFAPVGFATHYHANYVLPYWGPSLAKNAIVGRHIFYRWPATAGLPVAFRQRYARHETDPRDLRTAALMVDQAWSQTARVDEVPIDFVAEPKLELASTIVMLAAGSSDRDRDHQDAERWFAAFSQHPAVQIYRGVGVGGAEQGPAGNPADLLVKASITTDPDPAPPPVPDAWKNPTVFLASLVDFTRQSDFDGFLKSQQPQYRMAAKLAKRSMGVPAALWRDYTGLSLAPGRAILAPAPLPRSSVCLARHLGAQRLPIVQWPDAGSPIGAEDALITAGLPQAALFAGRSASALLEEQIVRAVFTRIEALSHGPRAGDLAARREAKRGFTAVPFLAAKLTQYERHRGQYSTLREFIPSLLATVQSDGHDGNEAGAHIRCS